jgi:ribonuclease-3
LGAFFLDGKTIAIENFLKNLYLPCLDELMSNLSTYNSKAVLQEYAQKEKQNLPVYSLKNESGVDHDKVFDVEVNFSNENGDEILALGSGKTKKEAEKNAAFRACLKLGLIKENE